MATTYPNALTEHAAAGHKIYGENRATEWTSVGWDSEFEMVVESPAEIHYEGVQYFCATCEHTQLHDDR